MAARYHGMVMRVSIDCKGCYRKMKRILLSMKEVESHMIERHPYNRVIVSGRFRPSDVAIKIRKRMKRRIEILEIQDLDDGQGGGPPPPDPPPQPQYPQGGQYQYQNQYRNQYQYEAYPCGSYYHYS